MFRLCTHTQSQAKKHETNSSRKCILSIQPFSIIICDWAAFFRCKLDTGTGAACYTGGCENQSVGFRLVAIDIKGGRGNHQSREPREPTQTPLSGLPALNFRQPAGKCRSGQKDIEHRLLHKPLASSGRDLHTFKSSICLFS